MKKIVSLIVVLLCASIFVICSDAQTRLPKVNIAGHEYYVYEVKKGDSLYGISNKFGWNIDRLMAINPNLVNKVRAGAKVYFPSDDANDDSDNGYSSFSADSYPVINHVVKKGDSVYSIAKLYGVPVEQIYLYNPDSKYGIKRGSIINIPQQTAAINDGSSFLYYAIRPGDTLGKIAENYNTSVEQMLRDNKGISSSNFQVGDIIRISVNSKSNSIVTESVDETLLTHVDSYKVKSGDTWESVAEKTSTDVELLKEINEDVEFKKNAVIDIPVVETSSVEKEILPIDVRESSNEGLLDIYNDVHRLVDSDSVGENSVNVALIIEDPQLKRDNEFTRGALLAIDRMKNSPFKIRFKLIQDRLANADSISAVGALCDSLDEFGADLVIATHEKNFPVWLAQYGEERGVEVVNSFDVKNELYLDNPLMIHLLTPSSYFSEAVAEWGNTTFADYELIFAGKKDVEDAFADALVKRSAKSDIVAVENIPDLKLDDWQHYLIYGYPTSRDEVAEFVNAVITLKEAHPLAVVKVMGRPSWVTLSDALKEQFGKADVYFPSRFFFDPAGEAGKKFIADYSSSFGHGPIRSFPTYAVAGYDIMNFFIQSLASNAGDFNEAVPEGKEIQTPINLQRMGNWGGFYNSSAYILRYSPYGEFEKILIRK